jgi:hypothetical protein
MSSVHSYIRQNTNVLYTNVKDMRSAITLSDGSTASPWLTSSYGGGALTSGQYTSTIQSTLAFAGNAVFRDMGTLVYRPSPDVGAGAVSTILRKVQFVPQGVLQTGQGVGGDSVGTYFTGYVRVGGVDGLSGGLARIN